METLYSIQRHGVCVNNLRCGFEGKTQIAYFIIIGIKTLVLDDQKFLIDHDDLAKLATKIIKNAETCEIAADSLVRAVYVAVRDKFTPAYIKVEIGAHQGSAVFTAELGGLDKQPNIPSSDVVDNIAHPFTEPTTNDIMDI